jgi:hypothetical protein
MSTAFYPLGMKTYNNHVHQGGYKTWKGTGVFSNPVGVTSSHIRPLTNNDAGNVFQTGFGLPRPIKHYRKGRVIPVPPTQTPEINYNMNRIVKSSKGSSLGGGAGGLGLLNQMLDNPGGYIVKQNQANEINGALQLNEDCTTCEGVGIVSSYYPNTPYLTENPEQNTQNHILCCSAEKKALRRVLPASTNLKKNYYTTHAQYLQNRCQTYEQKAFNFQTQIQVGSNPYVNSGVSAAQIMAAKPGSPLSLYNTYFANCQPNSEIYEATEFALINKLLSIMLSNHTLDQTDVNAFNSQNNYTFVNFVAYLETLPEPQRGVALAEYDAFVSNPYYGVPLAGPSNPIGCKLVVYKPNNPQFAKQGAVSSSTRMLKLNVDTIQTNAASFSRNNANLNFGASTSPETPFILKNKAPACNSSPLIRYQNKQACHL